MCEWTILSLGTLTEVGRVGVISEDRFGEKFMLFVAPLSIIKKLYLDRNWELDKRENNFSCDGEVDWLGWLLTRLAIWKDSTKNEY